jgi:hypothetical protein
MRRDAVMEVMNESATFLDLVANALFDDGKTPERIAVLLKVDVSEVPRMILRAGVEKPEENTFGDA